MPDIGFWKKKLGIAQNFISRMSAYWKYIFLSFSIVALGISIPAAVHKVLGSSPKSGSVIGSILTARCQKLCQVLAIDSLDITREKQQVKR